MADHRANGDAVIAHDPERAEELAIKHMHEARQLRMRMLMEDN
jgi:DNA-binding FadR family transcriptional regulator